MGFPTNLTAFLSLGGIAAVAAVLVGYLKPNIRLWVDGQAEAQGWTPEQADAIFGIRVNLLCLAICLTLAMLATAIAAAWRPSAEALFDAFLLALGGAAAATGLYETVSNAQASISRR